MQAEGLVAPAGFEARTATPFLRCRISDLAAESSWPEGRTAHESVAPSDLWPSNYYVALGITTLEVARSYAPTCPAAAAWPRIGEVFRLTTCPWGARMR